MARIFWITQVIHPCFFDTERLLKCFPLVVKGMTPFFAEASPDKILLNSFQKFCDQVSDIKKAMEKQQDLEEQRKDAMKDPPHPKFVEYTFGNNTTLTKVCYHGIKITDSCHKCMLF